VWFYYFDFLAESGLTAPILVGAVSSPRAAPPVCAGYAARAPLPLVIGAVLATAARPRAICTGLASGLVAR